MKELSNMSKIDSFLLIRKKLFAKLNGKIQEINEKYLMQIKDECFGVTYGVKVNNVIEV